jgi:hypothetical protein
MDNSKLQNLDSSEVSVSISDWLDASQSLAAYDVARSFLGKPGGALDAVNNAERAALRVIRAITGELEALKAQMAEKLEAQRSK